MARMRSIKPEMFRSLTVGSWRREVRWTFVGLLTYADDAGRGLNDSRLIKAEIYPLDDDMTPRRVTEHLNVIADNGPLCRYEVDGRSYFHITSWCEHQRINRPSPSRHPPCPLHESSRSEHGVGETTSGIVQRRVSEPAHPHAQARASAEHGSGSMDQGVPTSSDARIARASSDASEPDAQAVVAEWIDHCPKRPPRTVIGQVGKHIRALLAEGQNPDDIRRGVAVWSAKGLHPSTLPSVVNEVMNRAPPGHRPSTTDQRVMAALHLADRYEQAETHHRPQLTPGAPS